MNPLQRYTSFFYLYLIGTGIALILFGILFILWPELLAFLVSFFFILLGIVSLTIAWRIRKMEMGIRKTMNNFSETIRDTFENLP